MLLLQLEGDVAMQRKKIRMLEPRNIPGYGLKNVGDVWSPPKPFADQLINQKFAEEVQSADTKPRRTRAERGQYKPDDPSTKDKNEAWSDGKGPKKENKS